MKANNLSISIPYAQCGKSCPYCISKMTGYVDTNEYLFGLNLEKARKMVDNLGVSNIMITSKGEPLNNMPFVKKSVDCFYDYPIDIQTNGIPLLEGINSRTLDLVNVFCISVDSPEYFQESNKLHRIWDKIHSYDAIARATIIMSNRFKGMKLDDYILVCKKFGIRQLTFRNTAIPENCIRTKESRNAQDWIRDHFCGPQYTMIVTEITQRVSLKDRILTLSFGPSVYDIDGISVTFMDYCLQGNNNGENIRSLVYQEDGHLYLTWDKKGSILW